MVDVTLRPNAPDQVAGVLDLSQGVPGTIRAPRAAPQNDDAISVDDAYHPQTSTEDVVSIDDAYGAPDSIHGVGQQFLGGLQSGIAALPGVPMELATRAIDWGMHKLTGSRRMTEKEFADMPFGVSNFQGAARDYLGADYGREPQSTAERYARRIGEFVGPAAVTGGVLGVAGGLSTDAALGGVAASAGGGVGSRLAEDVAPGTWWAPLAGGMIGSVVSPGGMLSATGATRSAIAAARPLTEAGREAVVGTALRRAAGGLPTDLRDAPLTDFPQSLGEATNNPGLLALQKTVAKSEPDAQGQFLARRSDQNQTIQSEFDRLRGPGNAQSLNQYATGVSGAAQQGVEQAQHAITPTTVAENASTIVRGAIATARENMRQVRQRAWRDVDPEGNMLLPVDQMRQDIGNYVNNQAISAQRHVPDWVNQDMQRMGEHASLRDFQGFRSALGGAARQARAAGNENEARILSDIQGIVADHLNNLRLQQPDANAAYQIARQATMMEKNLFTRQKLVSNTLAQDASGAPRVAPGATLSQFIKPGPAGADSMRQLLTVADSAQVRQAVQDYMASQFPTQSARAARAWIDRFRPALSQMPEVQARFNEVADRLAFAEELRTSELGRFVGSTPEAAISRVVSDPNGPEVARNLVSMLRRTGTSNSADALDGLRSGFVDHVLRLAQSTTERDLAGRPMLTNAGMSRFLRDHSDVAREILGEHGLQTMRNISEAIDRMTATSRAGYPGGSDTASMLSGSRFIDKVLQGFMSEHSPYAGGTAGFGVGSAVAGPVIGGPLGAFGGFAGTSVVRTAYTNAQEQVNDLMRQALLNPALGRALMMRATRDNLNVLPRGLRPYLQQYVTGASGAPQTSIPREPKIRIPMRRDVTSAFRSAEVPRE